MDIHIQRSWMYNRLFSGRRGLTDEFINGVEVFLSFACQQPSFASEGKLRCPCSKHKNMAFLTVDEVRTDLYIRGFIPHYWYWTSHGECRPPFENRCATRLKDILGDIRDAEEKPDSLSDAVSSGLRAERSPPEYINKMEKYKKNCASDCGGLGAGLHTVGSISHTEHSKRMKKMTDTDPNLGELFTTTHQKKKDKAWVDPKSKHIFEHASSQGSTTNVPPPSDFQLWIQAAGGVKKGRIYGLGSMGPVLAAAHKKDKAWVDPKSKHIFNKFTSLQEHASSQGSTTNVPPPSDFQLWTQAAGGVKKGRIYGLGSLGPVLAATHKGKSVGSSSLDEHIEKIVNQRVAYEVASVTAHFQSRLDQLQQQLHAHTSSESPNIPQSSGRAKSGDEDIEDEDNDQ